MVTSWGISDPARRTGVIPEERHPEPLLSHVSQTGQSFAVIMKDRFAMHPRIRLLTAVLLTAGARLAAAQDWPAIRERGVLRVVVTGGEGGRVVSLVPGSAPGFDREIIEGFAALHRLKIEFVPVATGNDRIPALLAGKGDVIVGLINTEARRRLVDFATEIFPARHVAITRRPHAPVKTVEELRRLRIGTTKGSSWTEAVMAAGVPRENLDDTFITAKEVLEALRQQRIGATVMAVSGALMQKQDDPDLELGVFVGPALSAAWAVRPGARLLREALDEYISNVRRTPTWNRLVIKYYGAAALEILQKSREAP
jgi:polar amino acid transport system substrate-binding protein